MAVSLSLLMCVAAPAAAQTVTDGRAWLTFGMQERARQDSPWRWSFDSMARSREGVSELDVTTVRLTEVYNVNQHLGVGGGYAYVTNYPPIGQDITENRFFGVVQWAGTASAGSLSLRVRLEDRLIEGNSGPLWRARPYARFSHPFRPGSRLALVVSDEFMFHLNTTTRYPRGMDQNRALGGISTTWSPRVRTEIGYLNQYQPGHNGATNKMNHVVSTTITLTF